MRDFDTRLAAYGRTVSSLSCALKHWDEQSDSFKEQLADSLLLVLIRRGEALLEAEASGSAYVLRERLRPFDSVLWVNARAVLEFFRIDVGEFFAPTGTTIKGDVLPSSLDQPELREAA